MTTINSRAPGPHDLPRNESASAVYQRLPVSTLRESNPISTISLKNSALARDPRGEEGGAEALAESDSQPPPQVLTQVVDGGAFSPLAQTSSSALADHPVQDPQLSGSGFNDQGMSAKSLVAGGAILLGLAASGGGAAEVGELHRRCSNIREWFRTDRLTGPRFFLI
jgi:hypothetical protein